MPEAGLDNFRFRDALHTATTQMSASGSSHAVVMKIIGHTQLKTLLRYLNIIPETAGKVASNLYKYLSQ